jgi:tetratricopeptide (TPR) repeat protein
MTVQLAEDAEPWRRRADERRLAGDLEGADAAVARELRARVREPELVPAAEALIENRLADARRALARAPQTPAALRLAAEVAARLGRHGEAEGLLARALAFPGARYAYAMALHQQGKGAETLREADLLLAAEPDHPIYRHLKAAALMRTGGFDEAAREYAAVADAHPDQPLTWLSYGHALKTIGRQAEAVAAYRRAIALRPALGEAWWSLANLKTVSFLPADVEAMQAGLAAPDLDVDDRLHLLFALGRALEDAGAWEPAFRAYAEANALARPGLAYDAAETTAQVRRATALLGPTFFAARAGQGALAPDPIFVVGLPRSGSTLVEQILASHSQVEGTQELPDLMAIARRLGGPARRESEGAYPDILAALAPEELKSLGEEYLARAAVHRKRGTPFFIDKMPNNFAHVGLIQLILPNAKIVDVRRHPLGCGFSAFKQHFAQGQAFSYDLGDLGRYYADYVALMAHFDAALPGRVHRVIYERLVAEPEAQVRALLAHCGLPFEDACLRFYENDRAVRTASSEQVRQPIFTDAADHWRHFEPWLDPLKDALGPVLASYPEAP